MEQEILDVSECISICNITSVQEGTKDNHRKNETILSISVERKQENLIRQKNWQNKYVILPAGRNF
jgi:hypothetical protein